MLCLNIHNETFAWKYHPIAVTNYQEAILISSVPAKFEIYSDNSKIIAENPLIKVHPKVITHDQSISNIT